MLIYHTVRVNTVKAEQELRISKFFNKESKNMTKKHDEKGLPESANIQVDQLVEGGSKCALDVGSGPGSVMISLLEGGVDEVIGIDLSPDMNKIAEDRIKSKQLEDRAEVYLGSFLDFTPSKSVDAVSLHRVLCCHPDREGMLSQATDLKPEIISLTIPRSWLIMRVFMAIFGVIARKFRIFQPFIHSQKDVDDQLLQDGYHKTHEYKGKIWVTTTYSRKKDE